MTLDVRGKRVLVMGLGVNAGGVGVARFLAERGAQVTATDLRDATVLRPSLEALSDLPIEYVLGQHRPEDFANADIVIRNPGVPRESRFLQIAREHGASVEMEMTLFFRLCPAPIVGITGTRGKTTTTMLTGALLREQYPDTVVAGNLRVSALEQLARITAGTPVVLELSSWQLEGLGDAELSPHYACVTNLSPDHLDRYGNMDDYAAAKQQILRHQRAERGDVAVLNADDERVRRWQTVVPSERVAWFSATQTLPHLRARADTMWGAAWWDGDRLMWNEDHVTSADAITLRGAHNRANIAAAVALARAYHPPVEHRAIAQALHDFAGVPDRQELVRERDGVRYVNDTTATTPTATVAALRATRGPVILIAGGAEKHLPLDDLAAVAGTMAQGEPAALRGVVLLQGTATERLAGTLAQANVPILGTFDQFAPAVRFAARIAQRGDTVLLSPACASFGMFVNEFDRGEQFRQIVAAL
jgi:UDP-N-acetylmuramoylalanine--D-glutamate ligase